MRTGKVTVPRMWSLQETLQALETIPRISRPSFSSTATKLVIELVTGLAEVEQRRRRVQTS